MSGSLSRVFDALSIRPDERTTLGWLFLHSLFQGIFSALFFSTANAQFLSRFGPSALPWAYVVAGVAGYGTVSLYSALQKRTAPVTALVVNLGFLAALSGGLWLAAVSTDGRWVAFALFISIAPTLSLLGLGFWGIAGLLFDLRQGARDGLGSIAHHDRRRAVLFRDRIGDGLWLRGCRRSGLRELLDAHRAGRRG